MKKRICGIFLTLALLVNQAALAANLTVYGEVAAPAPVNLLANEPVISVLIPTNSWVVANPYGMEIERDGVVSSEEIVSPAVILQNQSDVPVRVDASVAVSAAAGSEIVFVQSPPAWDAAEKSAFLYAEFQPVWDAGSEAAWSGFFSDWSNQILVTDWEHSKEGVMTLEAAGMPYSTGAMRIFGSLAAQPEQAWIDSDQFIANFVFSFSAADGSLPASAMSPDWMPDYSTPATPGYTGPDYMMPDSQTAPDYKMPDSGTVSDNDGVTVPDNTAPDTGTVAPDDDVTAPGEDEDKTIPDWLMPDATVQDSGSTVQDSDSDSMLPDWLMPVGTLPATD